MSSEPFVFAKIFCNLINLPSELISAGVNLIPYFSEAFDSESLTFVLYFANKSPTENPLTLFGNLVRTFLIAPLSILPPTVPPNSIAPAVPILTALSGNDNSSPVNALDKPCLTASPPIPAPPAISGFPPLIIAPVVPATIGIDGPTALDIHSSTLAGLLFTALKSGVAQYNF